MDHDAELNIALRKIERVLFVLMTHGLAFCGGVWVCAQAAKGLF